MSKISGLLDPEARATLDAVFAKWAAAGTCNPDDEVTASMGRRPARRTFRMTSAPPHNAIMTR